MTIKPSKTKFRYGNCAQVAICQAFSIPYNAINALMAAYKIQRHRDGLKESECNKLIKCLAKASDKSVTYVVNDSDWTLKDLARNYRRVNDTLVIVNLDIHLAFLKKSTYYDTYLKNESYLGDVEDHLVHGWWVITDAPHNWRIAVEATFRTHAIRIPHYTQWA